MHKMGLSGDSREDSPVGLKMACKSREDTNFDFIVVRGQQWSEDSSCVI